MAAPGRAKFYGVLAVVATSTPLAMLVEAGMRRLTFPPEFDEVRLWLRPAITPWTWIAVPLGVVAIPLAAAVQRWLVARSLAKLPEARRTEAERVSCEYDAMLLSTSITQLPAVLATVAFMFGAALPPVATAMAIATVGVIALGLWVARRMPR